MKIGITGSTGFKRPETVVEAFRQGYEVVALTRSANISFETRSSHLEIRVCDLNDGSAKRASLADCNCVIYLAADLKSLQQRANTIDITEILLEAFAHENIRQMVLCSSISVLNYVDEAAMSTIDDGTGRCENDALLGRYAVMKCEQYHMAESWQGDDRALVILRPGLVYDESYLSDAHAGFFKSGFGIAALRMGQLPLVHLASSAKTFVAACSKASQTGFAVYHLADDQLPAERVYLKELLSAKFVRAYLFLPWQAYGHLHAMLSAIVSTSISREDLYV